MIDHTGLKVSDPKRSRHFYDGALKPLGYKMLFEVPPEHTGGKVALGYGEPPRPGWQDWVRWLSIFVIRKSDIRSVDLGPILQKDHEFRR